MTTTPAAFMLVQRVWACSNVVFVSQLADLKLDALDVLYPGTRTYSLAKRIRAVPIGALGKEIER